MIKGINIFMNLEDEKVFSKLLLENYPEIVFLDGNLWPDCRIEIANFINECKNRFCYIWNKKLNYTIPITIRSNGYLSGPSSGPVIQFQRCINQTIDNEDVLLHGVISAGYDDNDFIYNRYIKNLFEILESICEKGTYFQTEFGGKIDKKKYYNDLVGKHTLENIKSGNINRLKCNNSDVYVFPKSLIYYYN